MNGQKRVLRRPKVWKKRTGHATPVPRRSFIKQGIEVVSEAIAADKAEDYERALSLYRRALEVFMTGVKYEKNPAARETILKRVAGYMTRAEDLKRVLDQQANANSHGPS